MCIIDIERGAILPSTKRIQLRASGIALLRDRYNMQFSYSKFINDQFICDFDDYSIDKKKTSFPIQRIFTLTRSSEGFTIKKRDMADAYTSLLKSSIHTNMEKNVIESSKILRNIQIYNMRYEDLNEVYEWLISLAD